MGEGLISRMIEERQVGGSEVNVAVATAKYDDCSSSSRDDTEIDFAPLDALTRDEGPIYIGGLSP